MPRRAFNAVAAFALAFALAVAASGGSARAEGTGVHIMALGDSLTAGYGLPEEDGFVPRLQAALRDAGVDATVHNAGVSGDTTAGGLARLEWALDGVAGGLPDLVIVELGANDALRGLDPPEVQANLDRILTRLDEAGLRVLLAGMYAPRNLGPDYVAAFDPIYARLAEKHGVALYPFFLDGVANNPLLNQQDGLHPNADGVAVIVERILPSVRAALESPPPAR